MQVRLVGALKKRTTKKTLLGAPATLIKDRKPPWMGTPYLTWGVEGWGKRECWEQTTHHKGNLNILFPKGQIPSTVTHWFIPKVSKTYLNSYCLQIPGLFGASPMRWSRRGLAGTEPPACHVWETEDLIHPIHTWVTGSKCGAQDQFRGVYV